MASRTLPAVLAVVGGVIATLGAFLDWAAIRLTLPAVGKHGTPAVVHTAAKGTVGWQGIAVIVLGIALIGIGLAFLLGGGEAAARYGRLKAALVPALGIIAIGVLTIMTKNAAAARVAGISALTDGGMAQSQAESAYQQLSSSGAAVAALSSGVYVAIAGGVLGLIAGVWALLGRGGRRRR